jgi:hypothetical protein
MSADTVEAYAVEHGLGRVNARIRLGGKLPTEGAGKLPVDLCLTARGAWLVAQQGRFVGRSLDAADPSQVRYERGGLRDHLIVAGNELSVPPGRGAEARRLIALGRVRKAFARDGGEARRLDEDRYLEHCEAPLAELVNALLGERDLLIVLLRAQQGEAKSSLGAMVSTTTHLFLSDQQLAKITFSELGDHEVVLLDGSRLATTTTSKRELRLSDGTTETLIDQHGASLLTELLELAALEGPPRLVEAARRTWLARKSKDTPTRPQQLLTAAAERKEALAPLLSLLLALEQGRGLPARAELSRATSALAGGGVSSEEVSDAFARWQFSAAAGRALVRELAVLGVSAEPWALALHRAAFSRLNPKESPQDDASAWDAELAEHELRSGQAARARQVVEGRLKLVAPDEDAVLAPERASFAHVERVRLYELLAREAAQSGRSDVRALAALARLEPSSEARLLSLARARAEQPEELRVVARAQRALACLAPGGLSESQDSAPPEVSVVLDKIALEGRVRHPLARGGGRLATRLSELVAAVPEPDLGFLRDFCEELAADRHADAARALARSARLLGLGSVAAYVSHGARSIGLRAFGSGEPFILIGQSHLAKESPYLLRGAELDFALGSELSHLTFGHQRVTAGEVWAGAAGKTREALVLLGFVVPLVAEFGGPRAQRLLGKIGAEAIERAAARAGQLPELFSRETERQNPALGQRNEEFIAAHRLVQLTADRAGLVAAGDMQAALRAVLLTRSDYGALLADARERGLLSALAVRRSVNPAFADLLVRVRALLAFYLSSDFDALTSEPESSARAEDSAPSSVLGLS